MKRIIIILLLVFIYCNGNVFSQNNPDLKRTWHWYFGDKAGLDFSSGTPVVDMNGQMSEWLGTTTMSDTSGNLLFYTEGISVWNKNHQIMPNGTNLCGLYGSANPMQIIAVPKPDNNNIYYVFSGERDSILGHGKWVYSIIDMSQQGGLGDVISLQNFLLYDPCAKITAVKHKNGIDIWIIVTKLFTNSFYSYLLTNTGINLTPVISNIGVTDNHGGGYLKASPNGKKLACAISPLTIPEILDFDNATGVVSNPIVFPSCNCSVFGLQFSRDNKKLYATTHYFGLMPYTAGGAIYQINLDGDSSAIVNSKLLIDTMAVNDTITHNGNLGLSTTPQIASDGKIYMSINDTPYLGVINNPNILGSGCSYQYNAIYLNGRINSDGMPDFISSYFYIDTTTGINERIINNEIIKVYPNPIINNAIIEISDYNKDIKRINVELYDVIEKKYNIDYSDISDDDKVLKLLISTGALFSGIYLLKVTVNQNIYSQKIIITKN